MNDMSHKELETYVRTRMHDGASLAVIAEELKKVGWGDGAVQEALQGKIQRKKNTIHLIAGGVLLAIGVVLTGLGTWLVTTEASSKGVQLPFLPEKGFVGLSHGEEQALSNPDFFKKTKEDFLLRDSDLIEADLSAMTLRVYKVGELALEVPIKTKGKEGSWWETPAGLYAISSKEESHFSSFGQVYQPWSMAFQGNFFIHGWPYYPGGEDVPPGYSGGCIRLSTEDAKKVFDLADVSTPVLVFEHDFSTDYFSYATSDAPVSAKAYLAADLRNNLVLYAESETTALPIASVTKLMTALVATEYLNLDTVTRVPKEAIVYTSVPRFSEGEEISVYQLLFPLLTESSNEAAETIARQYGRERFVERMNQKAISIGMTHTVYTDPSGAAAENVSTPEDLFMLAKYIYNNRSFVFNITSGKLKGSAYGATVFTDLKNFNDLVNHDYFFGGKVGQTIAAGETNVSVFETPVGTTTRPIVLVVLGAEDSERDLSLLLNNVLNRFSEEP